MINTRLYDRLPIIHSFKFKYIKCSILILIVKVVTSFLSPDHVTCSLFYNEVSLAICHFNMKICSISIFLTAKDALYSLISNASNFTSPHFLHNCRNNVDSAPCPSHCVDFGSVADVLYVHAASVFRIEESKVSECSCITNGGRGSWYSLHWLRLSISPCPSPLGLLDQHLYINTCLIALLTSTLNMDLVYNSLQQHQHQQWTTMEA